MIDISPHAPNLKSSRKLAATKAILKHFGIPDFAQKRAHWVTNAHGARGIRVENQDAAILSSPAFTDRGKTIATISKFNIADYPMNTGIFVLSTTPKFASPRVPNERRAKLSKADAQIIEIAEKLRAAKVNTPTPNNKNNPPPNNQEQKQNNQEQKKQDPPPQTQNTKNNQDTNTTNENTTTQEHKKEANTQPKQANPTPATTMMSPPKTPNTNNKNTTNPSKPTPPKPNEQPKKGATQNEKHKQRKNSGSKQSKNKNPTQTQSNPNNLNYASLFKPTNKQTQGTKPKNPHNKQPRPTKDPNSMDTDDDRKTDSPNKKARHKNKT